MTLITMTANTVLKVNVSNRAASVLNKPVLRQQFFHEVLDLNLPDPTPSCDLMIQVKQRRGNSESPRTVLLFPMSVLP